MTALILPAWAIAATAIAAWALWRVHRLSGRTRYLTAVLDSGDTGIKIAAAPDASLAAPGQAPTRRRQQKAQAKTETA